MQHSTIEDTRMTDATVAMIVRESPRGRFHFYLAPEV